MRISLLMGLLMLLFSASVSAQKIKFSVDHPVVQRVVKAALKEYIPKVRKKNEKIKDIQFKSTKAGENYNKIKGTVLFDKPGKALGNGNYRFKMKIGNNLLKPEIKSLKLQVARIWFIRFYKRVI